MRNKKLALLLLAIVTAFTMVMAVACKTASEQESSGSESSIEESIGSEEQGSGDSGTSSEDSTGGDEPIAEILESIPAANLKFDAITEEGEKAESSWFITYGEAGLEITVYVVDEKIYVSNSENGIHGSDAVKLHVAKVQAVTGYSDGAISILVDASGRVEVKNLLASSDVVEHGVTAEVTEFTFENETIDGYYVEIFVPYASTEVSKESKDAAIYASIVNATNFAIRANGESSEFGASPEKTSSWIALTADNTFEVNENLFDRIDALFIGDSYIDKAFWNRAEETNYDQLVARHSVDAVNLGVGGTKIEYWEAQLQALALTYAPKNIVIHIGVNDINDARQEAADTALELQTLLNNYHAAFPNAKIHWVSLIPNTMFAQNNNKYAEVNAAMVLWEADKEWFNYIDVFSYFVGEDSTEEYVTARTNMFLVNEGLHLNCEYGYPLWGSLIFAELGYEREHGSVMGDNVEAKLYHSDGWIIDENGVLAENTGYWEKTVWYNGFGPSEDLYFEVDLKAPGRTHEDAYPKVGLVLRNDDVMVFAYFDLFNPATGDVCIVYRPTGVSATGYTVCADWVWGNQAPLYTSGKNINNDYVNVAVAKLNDRVYMYIDGKPVTSMKVPGLAANDKMVAGVMGFNYHMLVKNATGTNVEGEVEATLLEPHNVTVGEYEGATITLDKTSAKKGETVSFTIESNNYVEKVLVNGELVEAVEGVYSFVMPDADANIVVSFLGKLSVDLSAVEGVIASTLVPAEGQTVTLTAAEGYHVAKLFANDVELTAVEGVYTVVANENLVITGEIYRAHDGVVLDGEVDSAYGEVATVAEYEGNRTITLRGVKTESGLTIHVVAVMNNVLTTEDAWWKNTNLEFRLNGGVQRYVGINGDISGVSDYVWETANNTDGKYVFTVELFVASELISTWGEEDSVYINYAWKTMGENGWLMGDGQHPYALDWNRDWFSHHLGGLELGAKDFNLGAGSWGIYGDVLRITEGGLQIGVPATQATIDGNLEEYAELASQTFGNESTQITLSGKAASDGLYIAATIVHGEWSAPVNGDWARNDNFEIRINDTAIPVVFYGGRLMRTDYWDQMAAQTTVNAEGKQVTTVELFVAGISKAYRINLSMNGNNFTGFAWTNLFWNIEDAKFITEEGLVNSANFVAQANLDGVLDDAIWTEEVLAKSHTTTANGATITMVGVSSDYGIHMAFTVNHRKALTEHCQQGGGEWWHYMGPEVRLGGVAWRQIAFGAWNNTMINCNMGYTSSTNEDGSYTTVFEIFVPYDFIGATGNRVAVAVGGVYETGFSHLWGTADWPGKATHFVTPNGIVVGAQ